MSSEFKPKSKRGGRRENAGRKPGLQSPDKIARAKAKERALIIHEAVVARTSGEKLDPVEALMEMAEAAIADWRSLAGIVREDGTPDPEIAKLRMQCGVLAADWFAKAAPYIRPRLAQVEAKVNVNVSIFDRIERGRQRVAA